MAEGVCMVIDCDRKLLRLNIEALVEWFIAVDALHEKKYEIYAMHFTLVKLDYCKNGYCAYVLHLSGSNEFDQYDPSWINVKDFIPSQQSKSPVIFLPDDYSLGFAFDYIRSLTYTIIDKLKHLYLFDVYYITIGYKNKGIMELRNIGHSAMARIKSSLLNLGF